MQPGLNATLVGRDDLSERIATWRIRPDALPIPSFEPGQFVQIGLPLPDGPVDKRSYSVASSPRERETFELLLAKVDDGRLTPRLWPLAVGDRLWIDPNPLGQFTLDRVPPEREIVAVATGTGLAPFVSMLRTYGSRGESARWRRFTVIHGARTQAELAFRGELEALARADPAVRYLATLSREPLAPGAGRSPWTGPRGHVQGLLDPAAFERASGAPLDPARCTVFLCGNPEMIAEARALLEARGFEMDRVRKPGSIRTERYW